VARYTATGQLDTTFNSTGILIYGNTIGDTRGQAVAIQTDGKIVVTGYQYNGTGTGSFRVRWNTDGSVDSTLGPAFNSISNNDDEGYAGALQSDGGIVVGGFIDTAPKKFGLLRLWP